MAAASSRAIARFEHEAAAAQLANQLAERSDDAARCQYIDAFLRNNVEQAQKRLYEIWFLWNWLDRHHPAKAAEYLQKYEALDNLVSSAGSQISTLRGKVDAIGRRWPEWTWELGERTPEKYSGRMVDTLNKLSLKIQDNGDWRRAAPGMIKAVATARVAGMKTTLGGRSKERLLMTGDIERVWRYFGGQTQKEKTLESLVEASYASAASIEKCVGGVASLADVSSPGRAPGREESSRFDTSALERPHDDSVPSPPSPPSPAFGSLSAGSSGFLAGDSNFELLPPVESESDLRQNPGRDARPPSGFAEGAGGAGPSRAQKRPRAKSPPAPHRAPPLPPQPNWATMFAAQLQIDEARVVAAATNDEREAAVIALNATRAAMANSPAHWSMSG